MDFTWSLCCGLSRESTWSLHGVHIDMESTRSLHGVWVDFVIDYSVNNVSIYSVYVSAKICFLEDSNTRPLGHQVYGMCYRYTKVLHINLTNLKVKKRTKKLVLLDG